jgi:methionyl-tRNA synthetase
VMKAYEAQLPKEEKKEEEPVVEVDPEATIDDFKKMVFKVGEVLDCKVHPDANKLLVSQIDVGGKVHQVVSGIAAQFKPEDLIGKKVMLVTNLKPVKLRGVLSEGMILVATNREGKQEIVTFTSSEKGSKIS